MKYKGSKIALGIVLIIFGFLGFRGAGFASVAEVVGGLIFSGTLIVGGVYLIYKGSKNTKKDIADL